MSPMSANLTDSSGLGFGLIGRVVVVAIHCFVELSCMHTMDEYVPVDGVRPDPREVERPRRVRTSSGDCRRGLRLTSRIAPAW